MQPKGQRWSQPDGSSRYWQQMHAAMQAVETPTADPFSAAAYQGALLLEMD
jgi:hypothetical protein